MSDADIAVRIGFMAMGGIVTLALMILAVIIHRAYKLNRERDSKRVQQRVMMAIPGIVHGVAMIHREIPAGFSREQALGQFRDRVRAAGGLILPAPYMPEVEEYRQAQIATQQPAEVRPWRDAEEDEL